MTQQIFGLEMRVTKVGLIQPMMGIVVLGRMVTV